MYPRKETNNSLVRLVLVITMGIAVIAGSALTAEAKDKVSKRALKEMIAGAKSAADHKAIADHYYAQGAQAKAVEHEQMAAAYKKAGFGTVAKTPNAPGTIEHCNNLAKSYKAMEEDLAALAKEHEAMAAQVK